MIKTDRDRIKTDQAWDRLYTRLKEDHLFTDMDSGRVSYKPLWTWSIVAAAMLVGVLYWAFKDQVTTDTDNTGYMMMAQENREPSNLVKTLEDGSVVFLAQASTLKYPEHFDTDRRKVNLQGEAFFDIAKKQTQTFTIETDKVRIEVLGTAFDVRSNGKEDFSLSVLRGKVKVLLKQSGQSVLVGAGEAVTLQNEQLLLSKGQGIASFDRYMKDIRFKDEPLENVLKVINMGDPALQIKLNSPQLGNRKLTVAFSNHSPELAAELICAALNLKCVRQDKLLILSE